jgi:HEAT repeat protein
LVEFGNLAAPAILQFLEDRSNEVRFYATYIFSKVRYESALGHLGHRLFDKDPQVREVARIVAKGYRHTRSFEDLLSATRQKLVSPDIGEIENAAAALAFFRDIEAIPELIATLASPSPRATEAARRALVTLCLQNFGMDSGPWSRWYEARSEDRNAWLVAALDHENIEVRQIASQELQGVAGLVLNYSPDAPPKQRKRAQRMLATFFSVEPRQ